MALSRQIAGVDRFADVERLSSVAEVHSGRDRLDLDIRGAELQGLPTWVFRTDRKATGLDSDTETTYVTYDDGEIVGLGLRDGSVRWRRRLSVSGVAVVPTALTVAGPGQLLIGTSDGRLMDCSVG